MSVKIVLDELSVQLFGERLRSAIKKGDVGMYRVYLSCKDKLYIGREKFLKWDVPKLKNRYPHPASKFPKLESFRQFKEWKYPMTRTKALIECNVLWKLWIPCAVLRNGKWQAVKLAWPRIRKAEAF